MSYEHTRASNQAFLDAIESSDPGMFKRAADAASDFTRVRVREDGVHRKIMDYLPISNSELTRRMDTDQPYKVVDKEPLCPPAVSVPFNTGPTSVYLYGPRYEVKFSRIQSVRWTKDVDELRTWEMDIRQVVSDNTLKEMLAREDAVWFSAIDLTIGTTPNGAAPLTGEYQFKQLTGGLTRENWEESLKISPSTPSHLEVHTAVINNVFQRDMHKWGRDEMGGDFSQDVVKNGWSQAEFSKVRLIITIKRDLVPDGDVFFFPEPKFIGRAYQLVDTTMSLKKEDFWVSFFVYETIGCSIGNGWAPTRARFVA